MFDHVISYQFDGYVIVAGLAHRVTYRLDRVGARGAVIKIVAEITRSPQHVEAGWVVVTSVVDSQSQLYRTCRWARIAAGAEE
jgi:hypothetical protein